MPLEVQPIEIPLSGGLQQDFDPRLVPQGAWLKLRNLRPHRQAGFSKRFGTTALPRDIFGGGTLSSCQALGSIDDVLLAVDNSNNLYEFSTALQKWVNRSARAESPQTFPLFPVTLDHRGLYGLPGRVTTFDWCRSSDGLFHAALETTSAGLPQVHELVFDGVNGALVKGPTLVADDAAAPRIFTVADAVVIVYADHAAPGKIWATKKTSTGSYGAAVQIASGLYVVNTYRSWDARGYDGAKFFLAYEDAAHVIQYATFLVTPAIAADRSGTGSDVGFSDFHAFSVAPAASEAGTWVAYSRTVGGTTPLVRFTFVVNGGGATLVENFAPATAINAGAVGLFGTPGRLTIARASATRAYIALSGTESLPPVPATQTAVVTSAGGLVGPSTMNNGVWPASRPFIGVDGRVYIWMRDITYLGSFGDPQSNPLAGSLFLVDTQALDTIGALQSVGRVVARGPMRALEVSVNDFICSRVVAAPILTGTLGTTDEAKAYCPVPMLRQLQTLQHPIERVWATWNDNRRLRFVQLGASTYIQPGEVFDRNRPVEMGFHRIPDAPASVVDVGVGVLSAGVYAYRVVRRHINSAGEVVRGAPSGATTITLADLHSTDVSGVLDSFTDKQATDAGLGAAQLEHTKLELYRTEANGDTFYLLTEFGMPTSGANGVVYGPYTDNTADSALISKPILYTGSQVANLPQPNLKSLVSWQSSLAGIGPDGHTIWISNQPQVGEQATWNEQFNATVLQAELTALGVLDEKLIAFSADSAYLIEGSRADPLGNGNFLVPQTIAADVGCPDERGLIEAGGGLLFRDRRAFTTLDRNLQMTPLGLGVQDEVDAAPVVKTAAYVDFDREARFAISATETSSTNQVLRFNLIGGHWMTSDYLNPTPSPDVKGAAIVASTVIDGVWYAAFADGTVLKETVGSFTDSGTYVEDELLTPWIRVGAVAGHQRTRRAVLQAERMSPHDVVMEVCQDYDEDVKPGMGIRWTSGWIGALPEMPIEKLMLRLERQKGSAVRVRIKSVTPTDEAIGTGEGARYFGLTLLCGMKQGIGKGLSDANRK